MDRAEQLGTFAVDTTAVTRWQDLSDGLQPAFKIDEDSALKMVLPTTSYQDVVKSQANSVNFGIGITNPIATGGSNSVQTTTAFPIDPVTLKPTSQDGQAATQSITTNSTAPTPAANVTPPTVTAPVSTAALPAAPSTAPTLGIEPQLQYDLATALLQHVRLLNRQIKDAVKKQDVTPYIITVKINAQPIRRDLPVDLYYDLAFAVATHLPATGEAAKAENSGAAADAIVSSAQIAPAVAPSAAAAPGIATAAFPMNLLPTLAAVAREPKTLSLYNKVNLSGVSDPKAPASNFSADAPFVQPLLNYDSIEGQQRTYSQSEIDSAALSILAQYQALGARLDASSIRSELRRTFGRRSNSVQSIVKLNSNTLRVRLGAAFSPEDDSETALATREHSLSFVVLIPNQSLLWGASVLVASRPHFRTSDDGLRLGSGDNADTTKNTFESLCARLPKTRDAKKQDVPNQDVARALLEDVKSGQLGPFIQHATEAYSVGNPTVSLADNLRGQKILAELWFDALGGYDGPVGFSIFEIESASFTQLPRRLSPTANPSDKDALLPPVLTADDKKLVLTLRDGIDLQYADQLTAFLIADDRSKALQSTAITVSADGLGLQATFLKPKDFDPQKKQNAWIEFTPAVPVSEEFWRLLKNSSPHLDQYPTIKQVLDSDIRLRNGRLRMVTSELAVVTLPNSDPGASTSASGIVTVQQTVVRLTQQPTATLALAVNIPASDKTVRYLRVRNATYSLTAGVPTTVLNPDKIGRLQLIGSGRVSLDVSNAVPAIPLIVETYELSDPEPAKGQLQSEKNVQQVAVVPVTP